MRRGFIGLLIALVLLVSQALPVFAAPIAAPTTLEIHSVDVYRPYIETDDQLWIVSYTIDYTTNPTDGTATDLFQINIKDAGGAIVSSLQPYSLFDNGFNKGFLGFYYSGASYPTWGGTYSLELIGNAAYTWTAGTPPSDTFLSINIYWHTAYATTALCQAAIVTKMRSLLPNLTYTWGSSSYILTINSTKGIVCTATGEDYITNTIYEARTYLTALFQLTENPASAVERDYGHSPTDSPSLFLATSAGTVLDMRNLAISLSGGSVTDQNTFGMFFLAMVCVGLLVIMMLMGGQFMPAMTLIALLWVGGGYIRMIHLTYAIAFPIIICTAILAWKYAFQAHY